VSRIWELRKAADRAYSGGFHADANKFYQESWDLILLAADHAMYAQAPEVVSDFGTRLIASYLAAKSPRQATEVYMQQREMLGNKVYSATQQYWWARVLLHREQIPAAMALLREVMRTAKDASLQSEAAIWLGHCLVEEQQWAEATEMLTTHLGTLQDPELLSIARGALIDAHLVAEEYVEADALITQQLATAEGDERRVLALQQIRLKLSLYDPVGAFETYQLHFEKSVDYVQQPEDYLILRKLALDLRGSGEFEPAILVLERSLPLVREDRQKQRLLLDLAETNSVAGHSADALRHFRRFISLYPEAEDTPRLRIDLARLLAEGQHYDEASTEYAVVLKNPLVAGNLRYQAAFELASMLHQSANKPAEAMGMYEEAASLAEDDAARADALYRAGEMLLLNQDFLGAAARFQQVAEIESPLKCRAQFKAAAAIYAAREYGEAVSAFDAFLADCPDPTEERRDAYRQRAAALFRTADFAPAMKALAEFAAEFPADPNAPQALMDAARSAVNADLPDDAMKHLTAVVDRYAETEQLPDALYMRAYLQFQLGRAKKAEADAFRFIESFAESHADLAPDVYLWLGDHFANRAEFSQAESMFLEVRKRYKNSDLAPLALYEAAKNAYRQAQEKNSDFMKAQGYILLIFTHYASAPVRVRAQANFLRGDIATLNGEFEQAAEWFEEAAQAVPNTELYFASIGRMAECYYSIATESNRPELLNTALIHFNELIDAGVSKSLAEMARYRAARIYELQQLFDKAKNEYRSLFHGYGGEIASDWYYPARAGFDLARLYMADAEYAQAERIYSSLVRLKLPVSDEAAKKAATLRQIHLEPETQP